DAGHGRRAWPDGQAAGHGADPRRGEEPGHRQGSAAHGRDHQLDDEEGAPQPGAAQRFAAQAHRCRLRRHAGRRQQDDEAVPADGKDDGQVGPRRHEGHDARPAGHDGRARRDAVPLTPGGGRVAGNETPAGGAADTTLDPATTGDTVVRPAASGHFTTMQVRGGRVQGFDLHVTRLRMASRELYGTTPGASDIRARVHEALLDAGMEEGDCTLRVRVEPAQPVEPVEPCRSGYSRDRDTAIAAIAAPAMAVDIEAPRALGASPLRLQTLRALRGSPHLKHLALAPQLHARDAARAAGFDDALLLSPGGHVAEGSFWNIALW